MQVFSSRSRSSQALGSPSNHCLHNLRPGIQRLPKSQTYGSLRTNADIASDSHAQSETMPAQVLNTGRRNALGLLVGTAFALTFAAADMLAPGVVRAALKDYNLDPDAPIEEVSVQLGTEDGKYEFIPNTLEFTAGKIYKLKLRNPSTSTHYFTAFEFAEKVFSILVLAGDPAVEVKGGIQEVALKAGASATWVFIPIKPGKYPLRCTVKGHDAMVGQIVIKRAV